MTECIDASIIVKWFHKGEAFDEIFEMMNIGALRKIAVSDVLHLAKSIELNYSLYAADTI